MDAKSIVAHRIKLLREDMKMSQDEFIYRLSISKRTLASYEACETYPNVQKAVHIANAYNVEVEWLTNPFNYNSDLPIPYIDAKLHQPLHVNTIPLYPSLKASCSCDSVVCNCDNLESEPIQLPQEYLREYLGINSTHGVHAIIADGESMEPTIKHGDIIFVSPCEAIKDGKVYIININDETYCKRVYKDLETGGLILRSDNPVAPEIKLSTSRILDMKIIGRVGVVLSRVVL